MRAGMHAHACVRVRVRLSLSLSPSLALSLPCPFPRSLAPPHPLSLSHHPTSRRRSLGHPAARATMAASSMRPARSV
eukprot:521156-Pleurochrysis_carterae.AAC.1